MRNWKLRSTDVTHPSASPIIKQPNPAVQQDISSALIALCGSDESSLVTSSWSKKLNRFHWSILTKRMCKLKVFSRSVIRDVFCLL